MLSFFSWRRHLSRCFNNAGEKRFADRRIGTQMVRKNRTTQLLLEPLEDRTLLSITPLQSSISTEARGELYASIGYEFPDHQKDDQTESVSQGASTAPLTAPPASIILSANASSIRDATHYYTGDAHATAKANASGGASWDTITKGSVSFSFTSSLQVNTTGAGDVTNGSIGGTASFSYTFNPGGTDGVVIVDDPTQFTVFSGTTEGGVTVSGDGPFSSSESTHTITISAYESHNGVGASPDGSFSEAYAPTIHWEIATKPDIQAVSLGWNPSGDGAILNYNINGDLPNVTDISLFWSNANTLTQQQGVFFTPATKGLLSTDVTNGSHTVAIPASSFLAPPSGTSYLIAAINHTGAVAESDGDGGTVQGNDVTSTPLVIKQPTVTVAANPAAPLASTEPIQKNLPYTVTFSVTNNGPVPLTFSLDWLQQYQSPPDLGGTSPGQQFTDQNGRVLGWGQGTDSTGNLLGPNGTGVAIGTVGYQQTKTYTPGTFVTGWHWISATNPVSPDSVIQALGTEVVKVGLENVLISYVIDRLTKGTLTDTISQYLKPARLGEETFTVEAFDATGLADRKQAPTVTVAIPQYLQDHYDHFTLSYTLAKAFMSGAIGSARVVQPEAAVAFAALSALEYVIARKEYAEAVDPLDPNYQQIATPTPTSLAAVVALPAGPYKTLALTAEDLEAVKAAEGTSLDRAAAAAQLGDFFWQAQQLGAAAGFAGQASTLEDRLAALFALVQPDVTANFAANSGQLGSYLQANGLPQPVTTVLSQAGWAPADIAAYTQNLIQTGGPGYADAGFAALAIQASALLDNSTASDELQRQVDVQVGSLGQSVQGLTTAEQQNLDAQRTAISAGLATNLPSQTLRSGIESFLGEVMQLIQVTNNPAALQDDVQFGYDALDSLLQFAPAPLTIRADNQTAVYGTALPTLTATYTGLVNGDTPAIFNTGDNSAPILTAVSGSSHAGSYTIAANGATDPDYSITYIPGTLTITAAPLTVTANDQTTVYGSPNPTLTASYSGFVNGETAAVLTGAPALATSAGMDSAPGAYAITVGPGTLADPDYAFKFVNGTLTISKAATGTALTVSAATPLFGVDTVTFTAGVLVSAPGSGNPTGSVDFYDTTTLTDLGSMAITNGTASLSTGALAVGSHAIIATYSGDGDFLSSAGAGSLTVLAPASLSGSVFADFNDDGQIDFGESGVSGVSVHLTGADDLGHTVDRTVLTDGAGAFLFLNLRPGSYSLTKATQPAGYTPGIDSVGTAGGSLSTSVADQFFIQLAQGVNGLNYNYGERPAATGRVDEGQTADIGFWNNKHGQALIKALNGGTGTQLGDWLAATFVNLYGANAGANNLAGKSNAYIAAFFQGLFSHRSTKLEADVLATALSVYVTNATLDSTGVGMRYGFIVKGYGVGTATFNVRRSGAAFGVADKATMTVMDLLLATDAQAVRGVLYGGNDCKRDRADAVYDALLDAEEID